MPWRDDFEFAERSHGSVFGVCNINPLCLISHPHYISLFGNNSPFSVTPPSKSLQHVNQKLEPSLYALWQAFNVVSFDAVDIWITNLR